MNEKIQQQTEELKNHIQELTTAKKDIQHLAYYDSLTDLPNRLFFEELLKQGIRHADRSKSLLALFFIDIDDFKKINDTHGHKAGDALLEQVAERLKKLLRMTDIIVHGDVNMTHNDSSASRLGGDEFTILLNDFHNKEQLLATAKKILNYLSQKPYKILNTQSQVTVSMGISIYPTDTKDPAELIKNADIAMYQAKLSGKNNLSLHDTKLNEYVINRNLLEADILTALDNNEFLIYYQPKFSMKKKSIIGFEALVRWQHPKHGLLLPNKFLPIAEESDLIVRIDACVVEKVCAQIQKWSTVKEFASLTTALNVSSRFIQSEDLVETLVNAIKKYNINPAVLEIEITETQLISHRKKVAEKLYALGNLFDNKIKVSIDDFGVGYSSLNYLCEFPIDSLKIDRSFVDKLSVNETKKTVIEAIISLSHGLNQTVVAEGVENIEQFNFLQNSKCDQIQGFYLAKPMPPEKLIEFVLNWKQNKQ